VDERVQLDQGELTVAMQESAAERAQRRTADGVGLHHLGCHRRAARTRRTTTPPGLDGRPEDLVDLLGLVERLAPFAHPRRDDGVELVEPFHELLTALVEPDPLAAPEPRRQSSDPVRVVVHPPRRGRQRSVWSCMHGPVTSVPNGMDARGRRTTQRCAEELGIAHGASRV